mmetsp:Transcript_29432/g.77386  ORF Transcript_29432/g.77386 Transcript_29432/m.77386 type:complete len:454 (-) Transcript_29432:324-1685(-)
MQKTRVAIIGAGPSGLSALRAFNDAKQEELDIVCFEKSNDWGGQWNLTWQTGVDSTGEPVHSSMYHHLWSNGPKECLEYPDYTFDEHAGKPTPSYARREVLRDYILARATKYNLKRFVHFNTIVRDVSFDPATSIFTIRTEDAKTSEVSVTQHDYVLVATGHFSMPHIPTFDGFESFPGRILHAHDFRDARQFTGQRVLVIGSSYSAEDIALQLVKFGAAGVVISYRTAPMGYRWPSTIEEVPMLTAMRGRDATFQGGLHRPGFDAVILCTGYRHHLPFMAKELRLVTDNRLNPPGLYKGVVFHANPRLMYLGMQDQHYTFTMFDAQGWFARDLILGRRTLPDEAGRLEDMRKWEAKEATVPRADTMAATAYQSDYIRDLLVGSDYPSLDFDAMEACFKVWELNKLRDITTYRDVAHASIFTGTMGVPDSEPWLQDGVEARGCGAGEKHAVGA